MVEGTSGHLVSEYRNRPDQLRAHQRLQIVETFVVRETDILCDLAEPVFSAGDAVQDRMVAFRRAEYTLQDLRNKMRKSGQVRYR